MKTKLISAIKETIIDLETGRKVYNWDNTTSCNCGLLAQNICGLHHTVLQNIIQSSPMPKIQQQALWSNKVRCDFTGLPMKEVFDNLYEAGLTAQDISELETLSSSLILKEVGVAVLNNEERNDVLKYFRAWLRILERDQPAPEPVSQFNQCLDCPYPDLCAQAYKCINPKTAEPETRFIEKHESIKPLLEKEIQLS